MVLPPKTLFVWLQWRIVFHPGLLYCAVEVGRYIENIVDVSPISIYRYRYCIGTLDIGFSIYRYGIGDK